MVIGSGLTVAFLAYRRGFHVRPFDVKEVLHDIRYMYCITLLCVFAVSRSRWLLDTTQASGVTCASAFEAYHILGQVLTHENSVLPLTNVYHQGFSSAAQVPASYFKRRKKVRVRVASVVAAGQPRSGTSGKGYGSAVDGRGDGTSSMLARDGSGASSGGGKTVDTRQGADGT